MDVKAKAVEIAAKTKPTRMDVPKAALIVLGVNLANMAATTIQSCGAPADSLPCYGVALVEAVVAVLAIGLASRL